MKNNKEEKTVEGQDTGKHGELFSERNGCRQKWLATLCSVSIRQINVHYMILIFEQLR